MNINKAINAIKRGEIVIIADDDKRENEGDLVAAAELITKEQVNFMLTEARGLMCVSLTSERCKELELDPMVQKNTSANSTQFTVSVDLIADDVSTGISAYDRARTIKALVDSTTKPHQLGRPGHIFPLISHPGGVLERPGHTEAALLLCQLAGLKEGAVLIEIMNEDGSMARYSDMLKFSEKHKFELITVKELQEYLLRPSY
jgi:3,4-dihydroxy 2-butanone 4-phosphate synthase / GTP cyclohydrolase II